MMKRTTIWRLTWSHDIGVHWLPMRSCDSDSAEQWLAIFRHDESNAVFCAASKPPQISRRDGAAAKHVTTF